MSVRLKFDQAAFRRLRLEPGVTTFTRETAERVAAAAGPGFVAKRGLGKNRARYTVVPTTPEAYKANADDLAVVRALGRI